MAFWVIFIAICLLAPSIALSFWMVGTLDKAGRDMHKYLERDGDKYVRHIGEFGESTFTKATE